MFVNKKTYTNPYIVVLQCADSVSEKKAVAFLQDRCERCVTKSKSVQNGCVELNMEIRLKNDNTDFVNEISKMQGISSAVLVSYNGEYMG